MCSVTQATHRLDTLCHHRPKSLALIAEPSILIGSAGSTAISPPALHLGKPKIEEDLLVCPFTGETEAFKDAVLSLRKIGGHSPGVKSPGISPAPASVHKH